MLPLIVIYHGRPYHRPSTHQFWHQWLVPFANTNLPCGCPVKCFQCHVEASCSLHTATATKGTYPRIAWHVPRALCIPEKSKSTHPPVGSMIPENILQIACPFSTTRQKPRQRNRQDDRQNARHKLPAYPPVSISGIRRNSCKSI